MGEVTHEGEQLIKNWLRAQEAEKDAKRAVNRAECNVSNAEQALARWLLPDDAEVGEEIGVWMGDSLFQASRKEDGDGVVTVRTRGKRFNSLSQ